MKDGKGKKKNVGAGEQLEVIVKRRRKKGRERENEDEEMFLDRGQSIVAVILHTLNHPLPSCPFPSTTTETYPSFIVSKIRYHY